MPSLGLCMEDDVIRIAVGLRLGLHLCQPHECTLCGVAVDELGTHGLSCRFSKGRHARHSAVNYIIKRAMDSAKIPSHLEPVGLYRCDGKRPDGTTMVPWKEGRVLVWDATCPDTLAPSHITLAAREGGAVAADAEYRKRLKYTPPGAISLLCSSCDRDHWSAWTRSQIVFQGTGKAGCISQQ